MTYFYRLESLPREWDRDDVRPLCPQCFERGQHVALQSTPPTPVELKEFNCSRSRQCCMVTLLCGTCGWRKAESLPAPEMDE